MVSLRVSETYLQRSGTAAGPARWRRAGLLLCTRWRATRWRAADMRGQDYKVHMRLREGLCDGVVV